VRIRRAVAVILTLGSVAACGGSDGSSVTGGNGGGGGGGGGGASGTVTIGPAIQYVSGHNGTMNPAVDTIVAGAAITWTWTGSLPHSVRSVGTPSFTSSGTQTGSGTYVVTFATPGTYRYQCDVHGQAMTGTIVVLPASSSSRASNEQTASVADGTGDTFGIGATKWYLTALTIARDTAGITAMLDFSRDVARATAIVGIVGSVSDFIPNVGHLTLDRTSTSASYSPSLALEHHS
jgi:plastocyanin